MATRSQASERKGANENITRVSAQLPGLQVEIMDIEFLLLIVFKEYFRGLEAQEPLPPAYFLASAYKEKQKKSSQIE